jgi:hypothetical protein
MQANAITKHERKFHHELSLAHRFCNTFCQPKPGEPDESTPPADPLCAQITQTEQHQRAFADQLAAYLSAVEAVYDDFWRQPGSLQALNQGIWEAIEAAYSRTSLPYQAMRLINSAIRNAPVPVLRLSEQKTLTRQMLDTFRHDYTNLLANSEWLAKVAPAFLATSPVIRPLQRQCVQARTTLTTALTLQEATWQLDQQRTQQFEQLDALLKQTRSRLTYERYHPDQAGTPAVG